MRGIFNREHGSAAHGSARPPRHSRAWNDIRTHLQNSESLRVLDFGATSPSNINYLTSLGHSVYMANIVQDATRPEWLKPVQPDSKPSPGPGPVPEFDVDRFIAANLDFSGRDFDIVLLWDTANYLPAPMVPALFARLRQVLRPKGRLLAFFHGRPAGPETKFSRYQLTETDNLVVLDSGNFSITQIYQTRQIEKFLDGYSSVRFFLGQDNCREVTAVR